MVLPKEKLAFCFAQKVASQHFAELFNTANGIPGNNPQYRPSVASTFGLAPHDITRKKGWRFAMFVRDPLERYLSAFLDKCTGPAAATTELEAYYSRFCHGKTISDTASMEEKIAVFEDRTKNDLVHGLADDPHWLSQRTIVKRYCCEARFGTDKLDFLGQMGRNTTEVNAQVQGMLNLTSIPDTANLVERFFPSHDVGSPHEKDDRLSSETNAKAAERCIGGPHCSPTLMLFSDFYRAPETVRAVTELLKDDYEYWGIPIPNATLNGPSG